VFDTEVAALAAVKEAVPAGWTVEEVVGEADPMAARRKELRPGDVAEWSRA
jgi:hypothetical protein